MKTAVVALASLLAATTSFAQGSLSVQGFGYPPGQLSTRAQTMGGAIGELDPQSAVNPSSIAGGGTASLYFQYDPEFRTVSSGGVTAHTTTARFPVVGLIFPVAERWTLGLGASTLVDRSSLTRATRTKIVGSATVSVDERTKALGAIDDIRFALGWSRSPRLKIGVGAHLFTGTNQLTLTQLYPDSAKYSNFRQSSRVTEFSAGGGFGLELARNRASLDVGLQRANRTSGSSVKEHAYILSLGL